MVLRNERRKCDFVILTGEMWFAWITETPITTNNGPSLLSFLNAAVDFLLWNSLSLSRSSLLSRQFGEWLRFGPRRVFSSLDDYKRKATPPLSVVYFLKGTRSLSRYVLVWLVFRALVFVKRARRRWSDLCRRIWAFSRFCFVLDFGPFRKPPSSLPFYSLIKPRALNICFMSALIDFVLVYFFLRNYFFRLLAKWEICFLSIW